MRSRWLLLPLLALLMAAQSSVPLELPGAIHLPETTDTNKISKGLLTALANKKWLVEADTGESITARLNLRSHVLRMRLDYTPREITYHYVDSQELGYLLDQGEIYLHPHVNKWLRQLDDEVRIQVQRFYFEREPAEVVPVEPALKAEPAAPAPQPAPPSAPAPGAETKPPG